MVEEEGATEAGGVGGDSPSVTSITAHAQVGQKIEPTLHRDKITIQRHKDLVDMIHYSKSGDSKGYTIACPHN